MKKMYFVIFYFLLVSCDMSAQKKLPESNLFKEMWQTDTCGLKGHRQALSSFITSKQSKENFLQTQRDVIRWIGLPDKVYKHDNTVQYTYIIEGNPDCNLDIEDSVMIFLSVYIDNKTKKIISVSRGLR